MGLFPSKFVLSGSDDDANCIEKGISTNNQRRHGRTPYEDLFHNQYSFVAWKVRKDYLKCDIKPWLKPRKRSVGDEITLESLPTDFLDSECPPWMRKRAMHFRMNGEMYERVVGFRELMIKRQDAEFLKELKLGTESEEVKQSSTKLKAYKVYPYWRLARGGGPKKAVTKANGNAANKKAVAGTKKSTPATGGGAKKGKAAAKPKESPAKPTTGKKMSSSKNAGCFGGLFSNHTPTKKELREKAKKNKDLFLKHQAIKKWKWPNKRKRLPVPESDPPGKYVVLLHRLYRLPKEDDERDNEWLYLSTTTEDNDPNVISHFEKAHHKWMTPGISFESQKLFRQLALLWTLMNLSGRSFLHHRNNFLRGHIEFSAKKRQMLPFFLTTILLWTMFCMSICSYVDISTQMSFYQSHNLFLSVEKVELRKYWLPYLVTFANLILVSFWSLVVILGDGSMIAHYLNCWCAALHEMETSGALDIRKITLRNLLVFILMVMTYGVMFFCDWPGLVRGSCMITSMLLLRPSIPLMRINQPPAVLFYQCIGFGIQIYILFCARLVMCTLQVFALMVKNVSEMWNFKFALRFKLLAKENRGELFHLELNHPLSKLWSHHRLIVQLLEQYGLVFSVGIMCYIIPQMCVFAVALANMIVGDEIAERVRFYGENNTIEIYSDNAPTINIPYYHTPLEDFFMAFCIFLHICIDFFFTTETLVSATDAFMTGAEFVRRAGMMAAAKSHERRLIMSLQWSFSPTRLHALTANRFFVLDRKSLLTLLSFIILLFSILLRTHTPSPFVGILKFPPRGSCRGTLGQTLVHGICTITGERVTTPPPAPPPADYYFFMEHCNEIEQNHVSKVKNFEYYSDVITATGKVEIADKPPFQICRVKVPDGSKLPSELEGLGRYFQDHGNPSLKKTLQIYLSQSFDVNQINYSDFRAATLGLHSDSTGGAYCGPDSKGQVGKLCEWVEYYRDCVLVCYSQILRQTLILPRMWKKLSSGEYVLYSDYSKVDCGLNPFGFLFKGDPQSPRDEVAYDCFGNLVTLQDFDQCSNIWLKREPGPPYRPAIGDEKRLHRGYTSSWLSVEKTVLPNTGGSFTTCDKCYNYTAAATRCANQSLVQDHCAYSRYWGPRSLTKGYYLVDKCFELNLDVLDSPKANGFCKWHYVEGAVLAGHVVTEAMYENARTSQWDKEWSLIKGGDLPPCQQSSFASVNLRPIEEQLFFKHVCSSGNASSPGSCGPDPTPSYFSSLRPYELVGCEKLRQIRIDYETPSGNMDICSKGNSIVPENTPLDLSVQGQSITYFVFFGCNGKLLLPTKGRSYRCVGPEVGGVCEVDAAQGFLLFDDCTDPAVMTSKSAVLSSRMDLYGWKLDYGICSALLDQGDALFNNYRLKLFSSDVVHMIRHTQKWIVADKWKYPVTVLNAKPNAPAPPNKIKYCHGMDSKYCGQNSVALHYPMDGRPIPLTDKFLCNWEAYFRDCVQPFHSDIYGGWVYLPWSVSSINQLMSPKQRMSDPLLNTFWISNKQYGCDGRKLPAPRVTPPSDIIDSYWKDECGWIALPEFMDGDRKSLAVMPPILPLARMVFADDGLSIVESVLHCFDSEYALYRCLHPEISPICKGNLTSWKTADDIIDYCYRFNTSCYQAFNKKPIGRSDTPTHPDGFCRGYCPLADTRTESAIGESLMAVWRSIASLSFVEPPCKNRKNVSFYLNSFAPREIELRLFTEFHCSDQGKNGVLRDHSGPTSGSFNWPMYRDFDTNEYKFIPLEELLNHLITNYGSNCDYGGRHNENNIYPPFVVWTDSSTGKKVRVEREDFLGCHGYPLVWFLEDFRLNPAEMAYSGIKDPMKDYHSACHSRLLAGWCEAQLDYLVFLRDDFENPCLKSQSNCPVECQAMYGDFANHPLALMVDDIPGFYPFVKSKGKYLITKNNDTISSHLSTRTDLPYRRLFLQEFHEATRLWRMYKDPKLQEKYMEEFKKYIIKPSTRTCVSSYDLTPMQNVCHWPLYLKWCVVPCTLIWPERIVTHVSQSLVERTPGQSDMYLRPASYITIFARTKSAKTVPMFSFVDCVIDPFTAIRNYSDTSGRVIRSCAYLEVVNGSNNSFIDDTKWMRYPEFLPDYTKTVKDPASGFRWTPWTIQYPVKVRFHLRVRAEFRDPTVTTSPIASQPEQTYKYQRNVFASPYLACHRLAQLPMSEAVSTAMNSYWNTRRTKWPIMHFHSDSYTFADPDSYTYIPGSGKEEWMTCKETAVSVYLSSEFCRKWYIKSPVVRIYGFCRAIFPAISAHSSYAVLAERINGNPPEGCINATSNFNLFNKTWSRYGRTPSSPFNDDLGYAGFGIKYSLPDVYDMWNSYCHGCAYTREAHEHNARGIWCGHKQDYYEDCQSRVESTNRGGFHTAIIGQGIFNPMWLDKTAGLRKFNVLWKIATQYACWNASMKSRGWNGEWVRHSRWRLYHPWSQVHETSRPAAYIIHVAMNALNCLFPCTSPDESIDCNSKCPLDDHNPCDRDLDDFFSYQSPTVGLNYTVVLKENGTLCRVPMGGLNQKLQGLGVFGEHGTNIVIGTFERFYSRNSYLIYRASSEIVMRDFNIANTKFDPDPDSNKMSYHWYISYNRSATNNQPEWKNDVFIPESAEAPRFTAVHPIWSSVRGTTTLSQQPYYSTYCAGFEGDRCEVVNVDWDPAQQLPSNFSSWAEYLWKNSQVAPGKFLKVDYSLGCTINDIKFVEDMLLSEPSKPYATASWDRGSYYCCIPFQKKRNQPNLMSPQEWEMRYFQSVRYTWTKCEDNIDPVTKKSSFGWPFRWDRFARYLSACPIQDCIANTCQHKLRGVTYSSDTDLCQRQFDPQENFLKNPLPNCKLPLLP